MSRRRSGLVPSLFPFLAVLVCTLGTLILLLALVAKDAEETAQEAAEQERIRKLREVADIAAQERWRKEEFEKIRREHTERLEERRSALAHVEDHIRRIEDELKALQSEMRNTLTDEKSEEEILERIVALKVAMNEAQADVNKKKQDREGKKPRVVIVPHKGPNGTQRHPIYIECVGDQLVIQPEGVSITIEQLRGPTGPGNPLDAALRTIRNYRQKQGASEADPPYPLIIVRPSGVMAYLAARVSMTAWDDQFGYELVPDGVDLEFPEHNEVLKGKMEEAITDAIRRRRTIVAAVPGRYGRGRKGADPLGEILSEAREQGANSRSSSGGAVGSTRVGSDPRTPMQRWSNGINASLASGAATYGNPSATGTTSEAGNAQGSPAFHSGKGANLPMSQQSSPGGATQDAVESGGNSIDGATNASDTANGNASSDDPASQANASGPGGASAAESAANEQSASLAASLPSEGTPGQSPQLSMGSSLAQQRGSGWAMRGAAGASDGPAVVRNINMQSFADRYVLLDGSNRRSHVVLIDPANPTAAVVRLAKMIRDRVDRWGLALTGGRWQPILQVDVAADGEASYAQLRSLLEGSGITVKRRTRQ